MENTKLLIIEDNIVTLGDLEMRISQMGYENIETAVSGEEAIEIAKDFKPNLILSDINLGSGITGIEAVKQIKQTQDVPVIYLTAYDDDKTLADAGITEPYAYLLKPLQERELQISLSIALYKHQVENKLRQAIATKDRFISILGHDLRTPFNSLLGFSDILIKNIDKYDNEKTKKYLNYIHEASQHTYNLLNNLLEWSSSQQNKIPFTPQNVNIQNLIDEVYQQINHSAKAKKIEIILEKSENIYAKLDLEMIKTVVRNLVSNAIKFTHENGKIYISAKKNRKKLNIKIKDTGTGMSQKTINSLFKIDKTKSTEGTNGEKGTGFGLLLCKEFTDKHKGAIQVESQLGKGSSFTVILPLA